MPVMRIENETSNTMTAVTPLLMLAESPDEDEEEGVCSQSSLLDTFTFVQENEVSLYYNYFVL